MTAAGSGKVLCATRKNLTMADHDNMRIALESKCAGSLVTLALLPRMSLLQSVKSQHDHKALDWIPWRRLKCAAAVRDQRGASSKDQ